MTTVDRARAVANNLQRFREVEGLSLSQLAERSGVAKATLYKVERGRTNPTLDTLAAIAESLSITIEQLIALPTEPLVELVRAGEGQDVTDDESRGFIVTSRLLPAGIIEIHDQSFYPGISKTSVSHGQGTREHVMLRSGSIVVGPVGEEVKLEPGDYASYPVDRPHVWRTIGDEPARVWIVHTFPRLLAGALSG
ncbi:helix-turn-helix domain-containing protein [Kineococcus sp. LSe6-4]|uniref:Helix-turn-helix domain-containing protein n=1 Tax=Kineococcus halophytocola TaxID=3234027 RepID=A0ABV4H2M3_9ACTN